MKTLELWYSALEPDELLGITSIALRKRVMKRIDQEQAKSRGEELFPKLVEHHGEMTIIKDLFPTIFHDKRNPPGKINQIVHDAIAGYRATLPTATVHPPSLVPEAFHLVSLSVAGLQDQLKPHFNSPRPLRRSRLPGKECLRLRLDPFRSGCHARRSGC